LNLKGNIILPFVLNPEAVSFSSRETKEGASKEVRFKARVPIDWSTLSVTSTSKDFQIENVTRVGDEGRLKVKFSSAENDEVNASLFIHAQRVSKSQESKLPGLFAVVSLKAIQDVDVYLTPRVVLFQPCTAGSSETIARVLARGAAVSPTSDFIKNIHCQNHHVSWSVSKVGASGNTALVQLRMRRMEGDQALEQGNLTMDLRGERQLSVPFVTARK
jgi:hypothetical protein